MNRHGIALGVVLAAAAFAVMACWANDTPVRPKIYGIAGVRITVTDVQAAQAFYSKVLEGDKPCVWCGESPLLHYALFYAYNDQHVLLDPIVVTDPRRRDKTTLLEEVTFFTDNVSAMRRYLESKGAPVNLESKAPMDAARVGSAMASSTAYTPEAQLRTVDPEGHVVGFMQLPSLPHKGQKNEPVMHIIHAGFIVHDVATENRFYQDLLGFHLYWKGGMKDTETDWMDMQVPDGSDWIEYMLNIPDMASARTRGVMNHFAVGVPDIEQAAHRLEKNGIQLSEQPKLGRDGKWQLNLYDPDQTRVELMEFTPTEKPCCSEYTGPHPKP